MKIITTEESKRRKVSLSHDLKVAYHHIFNFEISKKYIKNKRVLDIGCWTGQFEYLAVTQAKEVIGIDPSPSAIRIAKKNVPKATFKVGNALNLKFPSKSFDCVTLLEVIEHLPNNTEQQVVKEVHRILKKDGIFVISTPNNHILSILLDPAYFLINHRHYSMKFLISLLKENNFKIIKKKQTGGLVTLTYHIFELIVKHLFKLQLYKPSFVEKRIIAEYDSNGFAENHIIAQKF